MSPALLVLLFATAALADCHDCGEHGTCDANLGTCVCDDRWAGADCSYHQKTKVGLFVFSFLLGGFGADYFYLGFNGIACVKLLLVPIVSLPVAGIAALIGLIFGGSGRAGIAAMAAYYGCAISAGLASIAWAIWWTVGWIMVLVGSFPLDANGYEVYDNM